MKSPTGTDHRDSIVLQYARRDAELDARRYSLFDAAALQAHQERVRTMLALWRRHGWQSLAERRMVEVGCGAGGNLVDLLRLGAAPECLSGIDLLPQRIAAARRVLPAGVKLIEGDATDTDVAPSSQDAVLAFTVFSSVLEERAQVNLANAMWSWIKPQGGVLVYDFAVGNPRNPDVTAVKVSRVRELFPEARLVVRRVTLAPPLSRFLARVNPGLISMSATCLPVLKTHRLVWAVNP